MDKTNERNTDYNKIFNYVDKINRQVSIVKSSVYEIISNHIIDNPISRGGIAIANRRVMNDC